MALLPLVGPVVRWSPETPAAFRRQSRWRRVRPASKRSPSPMLGGRPWRAESPMPWHLDGVFGRRAQKDAVADGAALNGPPSRRAERLSDSGTQADRDGRRPAAGRSAVRAAMPRAVGERHADQVACCHRRPLPRSAGWSCRRNRRRTVGRLVIDLAAACPSWTMRPPFMTQTRSLIDSASSWSWVTSTKVMPTSRCRFCSSICMSVRSFLSSAASGSSSSSTAGLLTRARASATRCCWPPDSSWIAARR